MRIHLNNIKEYVWTEETPKAFTCCEEGDNWKISSCGYSQPLCEMCIEGMSLLTWLKKFPKGIKKGKLERKLRSETNYPDFHIDLDVLTPAIEKIING